MTAKKKLLKIFIIIVLAIFLLSTGLISVLYLG
jgi:flagellar basal body-associated protein FliL